MNSSCIHIFAKMNKLRVNKGFAMERFSVLCIVILITGCQAAGKCGYEVCITRFR